MEKVYHTWGFVIGLISPAKFTIKKASSNGKTKRGKFMSEDEAKKAGYREAKTETSRKAKSRQPTPYRNKFLKLIDNP